MTLEKILSEMRLRIRYLDKKEYELEERIRKLQIQYDYLSDDEINKLPMSHPFNRKDGEFRDQLRSVKNEKAVIHDILDASGYLNEND